jgi:hypothetical protein
VFGAPVTPRLRTARGSTPALVQESGGCERPDAPPTCRSDVQVRSGSRSDASGCAAKVAALGPRTNDPSWRSAWRPEHQRPGRQRLPRRRETIGRFGGSRD